MAIYLRGKSYYYDFVHKGQRYTGCIGAVSRTVAKEEEHRKKTEVIEQRLNPAKARKSPRFDAFAEEYLEWVQANKKLLTHARAVAVIKRLTPTFCTKRLSDITAWQIEQYKKGCRDAGNAPATINLDLAFLKALLNKAVAWNTLGEYPAKHVKTLKVANERTRFLSEEEEAQLLVACSPALRPAYAPSYLRLTPHHGRRGSPHRARTARSQRHQDDSPLYPPLAEPHPAGYCHPRTAVFN